MEALLLWLDILRSNFPLASYRADLTRLYLAVEARQGMSGREWLGILDAWRFGKTHSHLLSTPF